MQARRALGLHNYGGRALHDYTLRGDAIPGYEGRDEGRASLLLRQLEHRFGRLSRQAREKVLEASPRRVDAWALRLLSASSLAEVLGEG